MVLTKIKNQRSNIKKRKTAAFVEASPLRLSEASKIKNNILTGITHVISKERIATEKSSEVSYRTAADEAQPAVARFLATLEMTHEPRKS